MFSLAFRMEYAMDAALDAKQDARMETTRDPSGNGAVAAGTETSSLHLARSCEALLQSLGRPTDPPQSQVQSQVCRAKCRKQAARHQQLSKISLRFIEKIPNERAERRKERKRRSSDPSRAGWLDHRCRASAPGFFNWP